MRIEEADSQAVRTVWSDVESRIVDAVTLEEAAQLLTQALYQGFSESITLTRVFMTVPLGALPPTNTAFVRKLAASAGASNELNPRTLVLSLVGTSGHEARWNDRRDSDGHVGIPLLSSRFVEGIPMIARLLKELGVSLEWIDANDTQMVTKKLGNAAGLFHVENAADAVDSAGRKIIAAQDFVRSAHIRSVFGLGGAYASGGIITVVAFCNESISRRAAERLLPFVNLFKSKTAALAEPNRVFAA